MYGNNSASVSTVMHCNTDIYVYIYTVGAISIGVALFFEKSKLGALIWHKPDLSIIISNKVMTF